MSLGYSDIGTKCEVVMNLKLGSQEMFLVLTIPCLVAYGGGQGLYLATLKSMIASKY